MVISCTGHAISPCSTQKPAAPRVSVAGDIIDPVPEQLSDKQPGADLREQRLEVFAGAVEEDQVLPPALPVERRPSLRALWLPRK